MVDVMGTLFTAPVLVPYGQSLGATTAEIASFTTAGSFEPTFLESNHLILSSF